jgi:hypothetical protein
MRLSVNLNRKYSQMAAESSFQTFKMKPSSSEKTTFSNKVEQRAVIKCCVDIGKTPTETHKFIKQIYRCDVESTINVAVEVSFKFAR